MSLDCESVFLKVFPTRSETVIVFNKLTGVIYTKIKTKERHLLVS